MHSIPSVNPLAILAIVAVTCGFLSAMIAGAKTNGDTRAVTVYGIVGTLVPLIGLVLALSIRRPVPPAGWRPDPWGQAQWRWHDGTTWTGVVSQDERA